MSEVISWPGHLILNDLSSNSASYGLPGGAYAVQVNATWSGGNVALQRQSPDGSTWVNVLTAFTADGFATLNLPQGVYRFGITTATAVYIEMLPIVIA